MTFDRDRRNRIAAGLRPDMLVPYSLNASEIHRAADDAGIIDILNTAANGLAAASSRAADEALGDVPLQRARLVRQVRTLARDAAFRNRVLAVYGPRCAISGGSSD